MWNLIQFYKSNLLVTSNLHVLGWQLLEYFLCLADNVMYHFLANPAHVHSINVLYGWNDLLWLLLLCWLLLLWLWLLLLWLLLLLLDCRRERTRRRSLWLKRIGVRSTWSFSHDQGLWTRWRPAPWSCCSPGKARKRNINHTVHFRQETSIMLYISGNGGDQARPPSVLHLPQSQNVSHKSTVIYASIWQPGGCDLHHYQYESSSQSQNIAQEACGLALSGQTVKYSKIPALLSSGVYTGSNKLKTEVVQRDFTLTTSAVRSVEFVCLISSDWWVKTSYCAFLACWSAANTPSMLVHLTVIDWLKISVLVSF